MSERDRSACEGTLREIWESLVDECGRLRDGTNRYPREIENLVTMVDLVEGELHHRLTTQDTRINQLEVEWSTTVEELRQWRDRAGLALFTTALAVLFLSALFLGATVF
jgi:hypothetical protein